MYIITLETELAIKCKICFITTSLISHRFIFSGTIKAKYHLLKGQAYILLVGILSLDSAQRDTSWM